MKKILTLLFICFGISLANDKMRYCDAVWRSAEYPGLPDKYTPFPIFILKVDSLSQQDAVIDFKINKKGVGGYCDHGDCVEYYSCYMYSFVKNGTSVPFPVKLKRGEKYRLEYMGNDEYYFVNIKRPEIKIKVAYMYNLPSIGEEGVKEEVFYNGNRIYEGLGIRFFLDKIFDIDKSATEL